MTPAEAAALLTKIALLDGRTVSEATARAWAETLPDVTLPEALDAVPTHRRQSTEWLMPAHILRIVEEHRRELHRLEREAHEAEQAAIEAAERGVTTDRSAAVLDFVRQVRSVLPEGRPDRLRYGTRHWTRHRRAAAEPNPHYRYADKVMPPDADTA